MRSAARGARLLSLPRINNSQIEIREIAHIARRQNGRIAMNNGRDLAIGNGDRNSSVLATRGNHTRIPRAWFIKRQYARFD